MKIAAIFVFIAMLLVGMIVSQPLTGMNLHRAGLNAKNENHRAACQGGSTTPAAPATTTTAPTNATG